MSYARLFDEYPTHANLWVYISERALTKNQQEELLDALRRFFPAWQSHGAPVTASAEIVENRFLLIAGYLENGDVSGCGIDTSTRALADAADSQGITWDSPLRIHFRHPNGTVQSLHRTEFRRLAREGSLPDEVLVFNPGITNVGELRAGAFEVPASESWHRRYFDRAAV